MRWKQQQGYVIADMWVALVTMSTGIPNGAYHVMYQRQHGCDKSICLKLVWAKHHTQNCTASWSKPTPMQHQQQLETVLVWRNAAPCNPESSRKVQCSKCSDVGRDTAPCIDAKEAGLCKHWKIYKMHYHVDWKIHYLFLVLAMSICMVWYNAQMQQHCF